MCVCVFVCVCKHLHRFFYVNFSLPLPSSLQPKVVTDVEDEELRTQMEELRQANLEVAGDDDASDDEAAGDNDHITPPITQD